MNINPTHEQIKALTDKFAACPTIADIFKAVADSLPGVTATIEQHGPHNSVAVYTGPTGRKSFVDYVHTAGYVPHAVSALMVA